MSLHPSQFSSRPRVLFYVQHLLGTGHLKRARLITSTMRNLDVEVYLVSGGAKTTDQPDDAHFIQLPALSAANHKFDRLVDDSGNTIDSAWKTSRCEHLLGHFNRLAPDVIIIESFPFGRRQLRFELIPLLEAARKTRPRPLVLSSVRDVVQQKPRHRMQESIAVILRYFDGVMVHGDPSFIRFEESFSLINQVEQHLHYTGYVSQFPLNSKGTAGSGEVLISAGGGAVSARLLKTALKARAMSRLNNTTWRFLIGPNTPEPAVKLLRLHSGGNTIVEPNRDDFLTLLNNCTVAVSQAGYNTITDVLLTGASTIIVPFEGDGETEQLQRARKLQDWGVARMISEHELSASTIAAAVDRCAAQPPVCDRSFDLDGANGTARYILDRWRQHVADSAQP